eukprot:CAMPEP_0206226696 /NCGR_PEP_ID=MMETSP0047_2-20121206/8232_1 /ASSEMBLY_ACC=CAM_ASM_000192 /TAXON_ID=195065 /ORGANISM="Chroomonas mesostigmatica_cf, Strain CCMP1168" /LENGTH=94 /DNA_ID=CAMNT_0053649807 /DNA_START=715 /DNA_END=999 /DNA_ORIENTATION=+
MVAPAAPAAPAERRAGGRHARAPANVRGVLMSCKLLRDGGTPAVWRAPADGVVRRWGQQCEVIGCGRVAGSRVWLARAGSTAMSLRFQQAKMSP